MTSTTIRCIETTLVSYLMCVNIVYPLPTWELVIVWICLIWVWLPDDIEIWI